MRRLAAAGLVKERDMKIFAMKPGHDGSIALIDGAAAKLESYVADWNINSALARSFATKPQLW